MYNNQMLINFYNNNLKSFVVFVLFFVVLFFSFNKDNHVEAQALNGVVINLDPSYPVPGAMVTANMETYMFDSDIANIVWYYNDKKIDSGIGKKSIQIKYPPLGVTAKLRVVATINNSQNYVGGKLLGGSTVSLTYAPIDSSAPIWYQGPRDAAEGGKVKMYAEAYLFVNGKLIPADNLIYNWTIDEEPMNAISGIGKSTPIINLDPITGEAYIQLTVKSIDGTYEAKTAVRVTPKSPTILIYRYGDEVFPSTIPYFYNTSSRDITLIAETFTALPSPLSSFLWSLGGIPSNSRGRVYSLKVETSKSGQIDLNLEFTNPNKLFQSAEDRHIINFQ